MGAARNSLFAARNSVVLCLLELKKTDLIAHV